MQVQVQQEDGFQDTRIYNGWPVYAARRGTRPRESETRGFSRLFPFFLFPHILSHGSLPVRQGCPSLGKDLQTRKSFSICSEMMFDLVPTNRQRQPGLSMAPSEL